MAAPEPGDALRILLCADNPVDALVITELLRVVSDPQPMELTRVDRNADAVTRYDPRLHDIVLLDLSGPGGADTQPVRALLARDPDAAVVALVATDDEAAGEGAVRAGAQDFVAKGGLTGSALRRVVRHALARKTAHRDTIERYRHIVHAALDAVVTMTTEGIIEGWNPQAERLFGWSAAEAVGRRVGDTLFPAAEEPDGAPPVTDPAVGSAVFQRAARHRDGHAVLVEVATAVTTLRGTTLLTAFIRDITGRRRTEEQLRSQKAFADSLIDNMPGAFALLDADGHVRRWNSNLESLLGYSPEDIADATVMKFVHKDDHARTAEAILQAYRAGTATLEVRLVKRDGTALPFYVTGASVWTDGKPGLIVSGQDLSERRAMESQLVHAQKMEGIGRLAGGVAHDFNNVLAAVLAFSELLLMDSAPDDPKRADVETIREAAMRATGLTRQLLAFSRRQVFTPRVTDLNALIAGLDRMLRRLIGEDIEVVTIFGDPLGLVEIDPGQIESAIVNLVVNARDAMPGGGTLTIETSNVELPARPATPDAPTGPAVRITVSDTGTGMSEEVLRQVFEPFFTTKELGKGTGLGLPSVYGIVKQSRGQVGVTSAVGKGTVFTIDLPRLAADAVSGAEKPVAAVPGGTETLIVAEDNHMVRRGIALVLGARGYTILAASNGEDALRLAQTHDGPIHLLLTDVIMPRMSATELSGKIREVRPDIRIVFMSGYMSESMDSLRPWAAGFLQKPFTNQTLLGTVRDVLDAPAPAL